MQVSDTLNFRVGELSDSIKYRNSLKMIMASPELELVVTFSSYNSEGGGND